MNATYSKARSFRFCTFLLAFCLLTVAGARADNVAVLLALEADMKALTAAGTSAGQPAAVGSRKVQRIQIGPHRVYAALMGSGCVETAVTTEALLGRYRCDVALSLGPAGGLVDDAKPGSWWRVTGCVVQGKTGGEGSAEKPLLTALLPENWKQAEPLASARTARLSAGETFISTSAQRQSLTTSGAWLVDMNTHGLAVGCANHQVPLHVWRVVSDKADEDASGTFRSFVTGYDGAGGKALAELIKNLPANPKAAGSYPGIRKLLDEASAMKEGKGGERK